MPNDGAVEQGLRFFPTTPEGYRFIVFTYPPESEIVVPAMTRASAWDREIERLSPA